MSTIDQAILDFIEKGAAIEHARWAKWQAYFFSKCTQGICNDKIVLTLEQDIYARWLRQIATPFTDLTETEKESDREEVKSYEPLLRELLMEQRKLGREEGLKDARRGGTLENKSTLS